MKMLFAVVVFSFDFVSREGSRAPSRLGPEVEVFEMAEVEVEMEVEVEVGFGALLVSAGGAEGFRGQSGPERSRL